MSFEGGKGTGVADLARAMVDGGGGGGAAAAAAATTTWPEVPMESMVRGAAAGRVSEEGGRRVDAETEVANGEGTEGKGADEYIIGLVLVVVVGTVA